MATDFERALLNARIQFAYYLTIQKPGSLEAGMAQLAKAKSTLGQLETRIAAGESAAQMRPVLEQLHGALKEYEATRDLVVGAVTSGNWTSERRDALTPRWAKLGVQLVGTAAQIRQMMSQETEMDLQDSSRLLVLMSRWTTGICAATVILALLLSTWTIHRIRGELRGVADDLSRGSSHVAGAATRVAASSQSLSEGASTEAASLEETSASMTEISAVATRNREGSHTAAALMKSAEAKFQEADGSLVGAVAAMADISSQSDRISRIIKVIDEIAFQTNILALNAAVEAARAGEAGMGFAIVADEVRNLAQRSAQAAKDTASLIEESIGKSADGRAKVDHVASAIRSVHDPIAQVKALIAEVALSSNEQSRGTEQVGKALSQLEQVTQSTVASAEECAAAAQDMHEQSAEMEDAVRRLTALVGH